MTPDVDDHINAALWLMQAYGYSRRTATRMIRDMADQSWEYVRQSRALAKPMPSKAIH